MKAGICPPPKADELISDEDVAVVVDALRASVTVTTLLDCGAKSVEPVSEVPEEREEGRVYVGEDYGKRIQGFDFGNSPLEIRDNSDRVKGERVVLRTTNGTRCVERVKEARHVIMGSLTNFDAVSEACEELSTDRVWFVPAGRHGEKAPEDDYTVLRYVEELSERNDDVDKSTEGLDGTDTETLDIDRLSLFRESDTGKFLRENGEGEDIDFCSQLNVFDVVPFLSKGEFVDANTEM